MINDFILFMAGLLVGATNAIAGGGMLIGFPVMLSLGITPLVANVTAPLVALPGLLSTAISYRKYLKKVPRQYLFLLLPTTIGSAAGAIILRHTSADSFERIVPALILTAVILFSYQPFLYKYLHAHLHSPSRVRSHIKPIVVASLAIFPLAVYGGFFSAGFGFIVLAFLSFTKLHDHIHRMNALRNIIGICMTTTALIFLLGSHLIDWHHGLVMGAGSMIGGYYAAFYMQKISGHVLRILVIIIGIAAVLYLGLRDY